MVVSLTVMSDLLQTVVPVQYPSFDELEDDGQAQADQAEHDDAAPHLWNGEVALELHDGEAEDDSEADCEEQANREAAEARQHILDESVTDPGGPQRLGELDRLRHEEVRGPEGQRPPEHDEQNGQAEEIGDAFEGTHSTTSPLTEGCHDSTCFSTRRAARLISTPIMPVARTRAYIEEMAPPDWVRAICLPRPGVPMMSSAVMARIRATAAARRSPVIR